MRITSRDFLLAWALWASFCVQTSVIRGTYLALEHMSREHGKDGGIIINVSSMAGRSMSIRLKGGGGWGGVLGLCQTCTLWLYNLETRVGARQHAAASAALVFYQHWVTELLPTCFTPFSNLNFSFLSLSSSARLHGHKTRGHWLHQSYGGKRSIL